MTDYRFKEGFRARAVKADVVAAELERLKAQDGDLTAVAVFDAARPAKAALHGEFEWDGRAAIRALGIDRARKLIRAVVEVPAPADEPPRRVWVHVPDDRGMNGTYEKIAVVVGEADLFERAVSELQRKFDAAAEALDELRQVATGAPNPDRLAAIGLAVQGFGAVREALAILK